MKEIPLTRGLVALVDDSDYEWLSQWKWRAQKITQGRFVKYYAVRLVRVNGKRTTIYMHRLIMDAPRGMDVDHVDRNGLNNQRENLRLAMRSENLRNAAKVKPNVVSSSEYKGVSWDKQSRKWLVRICQSGKRLYLGLFTDELEAALAYDNAARELFGEFARLNFPERYEQSLTHLPSMEG